MEKRPRGCSNGKKVPIHICRTKSCWPYMGDVCHPEHVTLPKMFAPHICDSCGGEECLWIFNNVKVMRCPGYNGPLEGKRGMIALFGEFDWNKDYRARKNGRL